MRNEVTGQHVDKNLGTVIYEVDTLVVLGPVSVHSFKKSGGGLCIDNAKNTIQLDDSISQEEINKRYRGLFLMFVLSAILMAFWYPALFNHHPVGAPASYMAAGGFFAMSLFLLKYKKAVKQQIHVNLVAKKQGY